ncbi:hypothetical protein DPMN_169929 [Dreissena polymorpha]|uniref:Uncharacterized protein n=1 Tax=Dreissena polymorpha TaxID=45954 RepID=A0A9D4IDT4_DREPO|nr:hypothetical protein DPMN_169929 [Dreissena polymorpha]
MARQRPMRLVTGPCIVEIYCIVIREVQYQLEVNRKGNFGWVWPMRAGHPRVGNGAMHKVQYQFELNRCRNEEITVKGNFEWVWSMWAGHPRVEMGPCIVEIDRIVIREVQNEEIIVKGNFGWVWSMWAGRPTVVMGPCIDEIDLNWCRNEEVNFQGSSANSVGGDSGQDGRTDRQTDGRDSHNIPTLFKKRGDKDY